MTPTTGHPTGSVAAAGLVCDFCSDPQPVWQYRSTPITVLVVTDTAAAGRDFGQRWAACQRCADMIDAGDAPGLLARTMAEIPTSRAHRDEITSSVAALQKAFLDSRLPGRIPIAAPAWSMRPQMLPKVRDRLATFWRDRASATFTAALNPLHGSGTPQTPGGGRAVLRAAADDLLAAGLYYVDPTFTQLAVRAGHTLPDLQLPAEQLPQPSGLLVWATPITTGPGPPIVAAHWGIRGTTPWVCFYTPSGTGLSGPALQTHREHLGWLAPVHDPAGPPVASLMATLVATWLLIDQPGLADLAPTPAERAIHRAYARAGRAAPVIRLVRLRHRPTAPGSQANAEATGRAYSHRWWVDPYWREQPYGPGRALRRRRLVAGSVRGPADKPLLLKPTVRVLGSTRDPDTRPSQTPQE